MNRRCRTLAAILALVAVGGLLLLSRDRPQVQRLADGTEIRLNGVIIATNAQYLHGKLAEKFFRGLIPAKGLKILQFDLQRPSVRKFGFKHPALVAVFQASTYLNLDAPGQPRRHRFLVFGENDSFGYVTEVREFSRERDGYFSYLMMEAFPRGSRTLRFQLQSRDQTGWRSIAQFAVRNPRRAKPRTDWPDAQRLPAAARVGDLGVELSLVTVDPESTAFQNDIWKDAVTFHWRIQKSSQVLTNWAARELRVEDALGNRMQASGHLRLTDGAASNQYWRSPDPEQVWRIEAELGPASGFAFTNVYHLVFPPGTTSETVTNLNGIDFSIQRSELSAGLRLVHEIEERRLTFIEARSADGTSLRPMGSNWAQHHWNGFDFGRVDSKGRVHLGELPLQDMIITVAVHQNVPVEFLFRPTLLSHSRSGSRKPCKPDSTDGAWTCRVTNLACSSTRGPRTVEALCCRTIDLSVLSCSGARCEDPRLSVSFATSFADSNPWRCNVRHYQARISSRLFNAMPTAAVPRL